MSLRARLVLAVAVTAVVALVVAGIATYSALRSSLLGNTDTTLEQTAQQLTTFVARPFGGTRFPGFGATGPGGAFRAPGSTTPGSTSSGSTTPGSTGSGSTGSGSVGTSGRVPGNSAEPGEQPPRVIQTRASGLFVELLSSRGHVVRGPFPVYEHGRAYAPKIPAPVPGLSSSRASGSAESLFSTSSATAGGPPFRVLVVRQPNGEILIIGRSLADVDSTLNQLLLIELAVAGGAVLASLVLGWWFVRLGLKPLSDVEETAEQIAGSGLGLRVPGENERTEVGRLARTLNLMLGRIERAFAERAASEAALRRSEEQLRQFVADASHELRTPLAAVSAYAELFERGARERPEDLIRVMTGIREETARMGKLVEDLLLLARLDEGRPLDAVPVDLVAVTAEAVRTARTVGPQWPISLSASGPVEVTGDEHRLRQVLDNLLANVRAHTPAGTPARVRVSSEDAWASIEVSDEGPGVPPEQASRMFERFYRADPSRSRAHGGAGLGLSIVGAIVAAHGGTVAAQARPGGGIVVTVRLPRLADSAIEEEDGGPVGVLDSAGGSSEVLPRKPTVRSEVRSSS